MTAAEWARQVVEEAFREWTPRPLSALDAKEHFYQGIITRLTRALLSLVTEVREEYADEIAHLRAEVAHHKRLLARLRAALDLLQDHHCNSPCYGKGEHMAVMETVNAALDGEGNND